MPSVGVRVGDVTRPQMGQHLVRGVLLHGELPRRVDGTRGTGAGGAAAHGPRGTVLPQAAARSRKAVLRLQRVLGLSHVVAVPGDLVRQPARGAVLDLLPADVPVKAGRGRAVLAGVP